MSQHRANAIALPPRETLNESHDRKIACAWCPRTISQIRTLSFMLEGEAGSSVQRSSELREVGVRRRICTISKTHERHAIVICFSLCVTGRHASIGFGFSWQSGPQTMSPAARSQRLRKVTSAPHPARDFFLLTLCFVVQSVRWLGSVSVRCTLLSGCSPGSLCTPLC